MSHIDNPNHETDRLARMIGAQKLLQSTSFDTDFRDMSTQERVDYIKENVLALTDELHELLAETSWKPWAKSEFLNEERAMSELVDVLHFFMNIAIGIYPWLSPGDIAEVITMGYEKKRGINVQRQEDGYDGVSTKCFECKTALDDPGVESMFINQVPHCVPCGTSE